MTEQQRREARAACEAATPGEWAWRWPSGAHAPHLVCPNHGMLLVMDAVRDGMNAATVRFASRTDRMGGLMFKAAAFMPDTDPRRADYQEPSSPDMRFIALARTALPAALDYIDQLRAALESIASIGGNLPDDRLTDRTGPNDAAHRGTMYCIARATANAALHPEPESKDAD